MDEEERKVEITEGQVVRWLCYVGFFFCLISLVVSLSNAGPWIGFLLGAIGFGYPAVKMYVLHEDEGRTARAQAAWRAQSAQSKGWDMADDEGDPTVPPRGNR